MPLRQIRPGTCDFLFYIHFFCFFSFTGFSSSSAPLFVLPPALFSSIAIKTSSSKVSMPKSLICSNFFGPASFPTTTQSGGNPILRSRLQLGEKWLSITTNLLTALYCLHLRYKKRSLWIDQLGINQGDLKECSSQFNKTGSPQRQARHIVAC